MAKRMPVTGKKRVNFEVKASPGSSVFVAGSFNGWKVGDKALEDTQGDGRFSVTLMLPKGRHEYKFIIDDVWCVDPECPEWVPNEHGSLNSVLQVE